MSLNLSSIKALFDTFLTQAEEINSLLEGKKKVPYRATKEIRATAQSIKVAMQETRTEASVISKLKAE